MESFVYKSATNFLMVCNAFNMVGNVSLCKYHEHLGMVYNLYSIEQVTYLKN